MEKHEYRGYEIAIEVERLVSGRFMIDSRITATSEEEKARKLRMPWVDSRQLHSTGQEQAIARALNSSRRAIDQLIEGRS
ncbi:hypothetical protein [Caballeronia ptereochthonis]|uniref:Uncharacterized protein n=1 Tax=Caballeronia ptereochthonis TaxID=1777144 RepID=A0A158BG97_9BURK|nr:hypothetical protein [Caballeronia ptereochthonis]SAK68960.1 hypothetical protein AWB83_03205 [Caballeronia ptereochthonis]